MFSKNFIKIEDVLVNREIVGTKFACDLEKCKGACCTIESDYGAPLLSEEIQLIEESFDEAKKYLSAEHLEVIDEDGFYETRDGEIMIRSFNNRACVFVYFKNEIAKCSLERVYLEGKTKFRKPISCHLFPIRISNFGGEVLRYEKFSECGSALEKGQELDITIAEICKDSLIRKYGENWYKSLIDNSGN
ncbi:MAG: DUF3109 family protein [Ignavibacteria bacterium]|nr:DUF3109 family protein [Ignavibacteria bacterium]MDP3832089.1 DUF3109 family protein [Ignavibacteriaceae bacterium]